MSDEKDKLKGTRYDDTLTVEGDNHAELGRDGELIVGKRGDGTQVAHAGDEVLIERSKTHNVSPCEKFGHRATADGSACRFCGALL